MKRCLYLTVLCLLIGAGAAQAQVTKTLYEINGGSVPGGTFVRIEDVIVTGVSYNGFYIQEQAGGAYSGAWYFTGGAPAAALGNLVDVTGIYNEYFGMTEIDGSVQGVETVVGSGYFPTPRLVRAWEIETSQPIEAEKWECVLVKVVNSEVIILINQYGEWWTREFGYADNDTVMVDNQLGVSGPSLPADLGKDILSLTGVLRWDFDDFKVEPRTDADIVWQGAAPAPNVLWACVAGLSNKVDVKFDRAVELSTSQNPNNYFLSQGSVITAVRDPLDHELVHLTLNGASPPATLLILTVFDVQNEDGIAMGPQDVQFYGGINTVSFSQTPNAGGDSSIVAGRSICLKGVVHSKYDIYGSHVYLENVNPPLPNTPYNGLEVYLSSLLDDVHEGDILIIGDLLTEYYSMTSLTEPFYYFQIVSSGNTVLAPELITIGDPTSPAHYEQYEGALVEVRNVEVVERPGEWNFYEWSVTNDWLNWLKVGEMGDYAYIPGLGDSLNIRGTLRYDFGEFKIMPRSDADIDIIYQNPISTPELPEGAGNFLGQNYPNPFNPSTKIAFRLAQAGPAELAIFDVQGRVIKSLHLGDLPAGEHHVSWDGETDQGEAAASGLYFYTLKSAGETLTRRMVLLK